MHFDLFYELSNPNYPHQSDISIFNQVQSEITLADELGFSTAWIVEHHFTEKYSHSSAPDLFLASLASQTKNIRLGHAIIPLPYNHPVRVAERLATLDVISNGRVEFGFGRGYSPIEYQCFDADMAKSREITQEAFEIILKCLLEQTFKHSGDFFSLPEINVLPKPIQKPHPPIWTAAVSPDSFQLAAKLGIGVLAGPFKPWFMVKEDIRLYRNSWQTVDHSSSNINLNNKTGMTIGILCLENAKQARQSGKVAFEWFYQNLLLQTTPVLKKLYSSYEYYNKFSHFHKILSSTINLKILETLGLVIVGSPNECIEKLEKIQAAGVDHFILSVGAGAIDSNIVKESISLIASDVMPHFQQK